MTAEALGEMNFWARLAGVGVVSILPREREKERGQLERKTRKGVCVSGEEEDQCPK